MPAAQAFLDAIIASPDDDAPRLAYADWLDEQGDAPRAEFIRTQIALARMDEDDERRVQMERREEQYLKSLWTPGWLEDHAVLFTRDHLFPAFGGIVRFERGFLCQWNPADESGVPLTEGLFREWPIREVSWYLSTDEEISALAEAPFLRRLTALNLSIFGRAIGAAAPLTRLLDSSFLAGLRGLTLRSHVYPENAQTLVSALAASTLRRLDSLAVGVMIGAAGVVGLAAWDGLASVTRLDLSHNGIGSAGVEALCQSNRIGKLVALDLSYNDLTAAGPGALARCERLAGLQELRLSDNEFGDQAMAELAFFPALRDLRVLALHECGLTGAGIAALAAAPVVDRLTELDLSFNWIGPTGAAALARSSMPSLRSLDLGTTFLECEGVRALAAWPSLGGVKTLSLRGSRMGVAGLRALIDSSSLAAVRTLWLGGNDLGDEGAQLLARWPGLARLRTLGLGMNKLTDAGLKALAASPYAGGVGRIYVGEAAPLDEAFAACAAAGLTNVIEFNKHARQRVAELVANQARPTT